MLFTEHTLPELESFGSPLASIGMSYIASNAACRCVGVGIGILENAKLKQVLPVM